MSRTTTTITSYYPRLISWVVLVLLIFSRISVLGETHPPNGHDHHEAAVPDDHHSSEAEASHDPPHDHSEHIHDETCDHGHDDHDHDAMPQSEVPAHDHAGHDHAGHDHSHSHNRYPVQKFTNLMRTIRDDDHEKFNEILADPDSDINELQSGWPFSALLYTFALKKYQFTEELIKQRVDVITETEGVTPLKLALKTVEDEALRFRLVTMLVKGGAEVASEDREEYKTLMQSGGSGDADTTDELYISK